MVLALFTLYLQHFNGAREAQFAALAQRSSPAPVAIGAYDGPRGGTAIEANLRVLINPAIEVQYALPRDDGRAPTILHAIGLADPEHPGKLLGAIEMTGRERARLLDWIGQNGKQVEGGVLVSIDGLIEPPIGLTRINLERAFLNRMRPLPNSAIWLDPYLGERAAILAREADGTRGTQVYALFWAAAAGLVFLGMSQRKSDTRRRSFEAAVAQAVEARAFAMKLAGMTATQTELKRFAQEERFRLSQKTG
ncbi:MAG: hypothetical protein JXR35_10900 [Rhodobacteraceae bacterium]|nr:hypothetical protein [Paracoccaceae bacterium]